MDLIVFQIKPMAAVNRLM